MKSKHLQMIGGDANEITAKDLPTEILVHIRVLFFLRSRQETRQWESLKQNEKQVKIAGSRFLCGCR